MSLIKTNYQLRLTPEGFELCARYPWTQWRSRGEVRWGDISCVSAYKRDEFVTDSVWLQIDLASGTTWDLDESIEGFWEVVAAMEATLPGIEADWRRHVIPEPFEENRRVIYRRSAQGPSR